jgi:predicted nucleotide-binding protein
MTIILVEDDAFIVELYVEAFEFAGFRVLTAKSLSEAKKVIENNSDANAVILDIFLPLGDDSGFETRVGFPAGRMLVRWIKTNYPNLTIIGLSNSQSNDIEEFFKSHGLVFLHKSDYLPAELADRVKILISKEDLRKHLKVFIVHGHDEIAKYELKNYLQNTLNLSEPIILRERPSLGRTLIEKFEEEARFIDLVFVLLTPDDPSYTLPTTNEDKRRARQNVIFEMGYFFAKLQRRKGRVILLYKPPLELPSDLTGIICLDISGGINSVDADIRKEVEALMKLF